MKFLQIALGYIVGRAIIVYVLLAALFSRAAAHGLRSAQRAIRRH